MFFEVVINFWVRYILKLFSFIQEIYPLQNYFHNQIDDYLFDELHLLNG